MLDKNSDNILSTRLKELYSLFLLKSYTKSEDPLEDSNFDAI